MSMLNVLRQIETQPFSEDEILTLVDHKANLVLYPDIKQYRSIDHLLGPYGAVIILYITGQSGSTVYGHWTCLFRIDNNTLEWFDPYGMKPDQELYMSKIKYPFFLSNLLKQSHYNIIYSIHRLQSTKNMSISTCGRFVGLRIQLRNIPIKEFARLLTSVRGLTPDNVVTLMTALGGFY